MNALTSDYGALVVMLLITTIMGISMIVMSHLLGRKRPHKRKLEPFECGMPLLDTVKKRISVKFFIVAVLFIVFDVEAALLYPWALTSRGAPMFMVAAVGLFVAFVALVFVYLWKEGAFTWEK
ncbi:MAG TPA: NADH-quinone oxidoreductase subunit A [Thermoanaerobaculia bacterium]|nr:NADH-quinone oxidoreductase subunit A [Thermoanaerobaculia bacterium]HUM29526.1 NADH-quinone oxidoreductase subunit A [Thermoanaerobaculia bacterium]HXK67909.1 NADH-quinone oxidoreductase subunit A [Thermoanaerobaculia bacterium]